MEAIRLTLETLYDILRNEKKREDLQKLEGTFFPDVVAYLGEKQELLKNKQQSTELFAAGERDKLEYELRSIKRILKEIYERREKKIIDIALNRSKTGSDIIDTSAMLQEEKEYYDQMVALLNAYRQGILRNLLAGKFPETTEVGRDEAKNIRNTRNDSNSLSQRITPSDQEEEEAEQDEELEHEEKEHTKETEPAATSKVRFIRPMPSFIWKDMKVYGPYDPGEEIEIYPEVAELLVRKGRAEII